MPSKTGTVESSAGQRSKHETALAGIIAEIDHILRDNKRKDVQIEKSSRRIRTKLDALHALTK